VADFSVPVRSKLANFVRLLASDRDGEVIATARAILRTLRATGSDVHALADLIEQTDGGKLSEAEMKKLYDAGYEDGRADGVRAAEAKVAHDADGFRHVSGSLSWHDMARFCQGRSARLRGKEPDFVDDMVGWTVWKEPTPKKAKWLQSIYLRLGGRP
jgi:hypothetical protein